MSHAVLPPKHLTETQTSHLSPPNIHRFDLFQTPPAPGSCWEVNKNTDKGGKTHLKVRKIQSTQHNMKRSVCSHEDKALLEWKLKLK